MKNYTGFLIILFLLCVMLITSSVQFNKFEKQLLEKAYELSAAPPESKYEVYSEFKSNFEKSEKSVMMLVNHSLYKDIARCVIKLEHDIKFNHDFNINIDTDELIFYLEETINGEKSVISNIF